ncbi:phosphotransferase family protein [Nonomuraea longispora]|uniref:phosphotransferase family protein n=1 Tax=Nonomuraea longispora TaxID=1848320 RepID=UPI001C703469|nr:phosphotransferase [Nonomuraea longispora]
MPECVVHGDAWIGNVVCTDDGDVVLLDLERCSAGPPEWDLTSTAVKALTMDGIPADDYNLFVRTYGGAVNQRAISRQVGAELGNQPPVSISARAAGCSTAGRAVASSGTYL